MNKTKVLTEGHNCTQNRTDRPRWTNNNHSLIITTIFSVLGLPGNALVIILILRAKQKKSTTTCLLLSLAIADIALLLGNEITQIWADLRKDEHKEHGMLLFLIVPANIVANVTLAMIALGRYSALVGAMKRILNITKKKITISIAITWFTSLILCFSPYLYHTLNQKNYKGPDMFSKLFFSLIVIFGYVVPLIIVVFCYSSILKGLYFDRTILVEKVTDEARLREKKRLVHVLVVITLVSLACNLPVIVMIMIKHFVFYEGSKPQLRYVIAIMRCVSSSLNPYIYGLHSENYRSQVKQLFQCRKNDEENMRCPADV